MNLIPVIEFEPGLFTTKDYEIPKYQDIDGWDKYWKSSLADAGIIGLQPYKKASWFVKTEKLIEHYQAIEIMIQNQLSSIEPDSELDLIEQLISLDGGYILEVDETNIIYPHCCGRLEDLQEWKDASEYLGDTEKTLWIGHPGLIVSAINENYLQIRQIAEYGKPPEAVTFELKRNELKLSIAEAESQLAKFQQVVLPILKKIIPNNAEEVLKVFLKGHC
jgi:hypothetical protein